MKKLITLVLLTLTTVENSFAQHSLSVNGGWTFSTVYKVGAPEAFKAIANLSHWHNFSPFHIPNLNLAYQYNHKTFRLSTSISFLSLGTRDFIWHGTEWAYMYLTFPVLFGYQMKLPKDFSLVLEGGTEIGTSIMNVGSVVSLAKIGKTRPYIGLALGVEVKYKRFICGFRGHFGLNNFDDIPSDKPEETLYFKHIGGTLYLGYTFWDSQKAKERRERRLKK